MWGDAVPVFVWVLDVTYSDGQLWPFLWGGVRLLILDHRVGWGRDAVLTHANTLWKRAALKPIKNLTPQSVPLNSHTFCSVLVILYYVSSYTWWLKHRLFMLALHFLSVQIHGMIVLSIWHLVTLLLLFFMVWIWGILVIGQPWFKSVVKMTLTKNLWSGVSNLQVYTLFSSPHQKSFLTKVCRGPLKVLTSEAQCCDMGSDCGNGLARPTIAGPVIRLTALRQGSKVLLSRCPDVTHREPLWLKEQLIHLRSNLVK